MAVDIAQFFAGFNPLVLDGMRFCLDGVLAGYVKMLHLPAPAIVHFLAALALGLRARRSPAFHTGDDCLHCWIALAIAMAYAVHGGSG